jgi:hypothetical protein
VNDVVDYVEENGRPPVFIVDHLGLTQPLVPPAPPDVSASAQWDTSVTGR